jgi:hypothetical protein
VAITVINSTARGIGAAASTWSIVPHSSKHGGAAYIVGVTFGSSDVSVVDITDTSGNVFALAAACPSPKPTACGAELWYATNVSSASTRIFLTISGASSGIVAILQADGVSTANALGVTGSSANEDLSTVHDVFDITPTAANSLVVSVYSNHDDTVAPVVSDGGQSSWVAITPQRMVAQYLVQGAASTYSGTWRTDAATSTGGVRHAAVIAAFNDTFTAGAAGPVYRKSRMLFGVGS